MLTADLVAPSFGEGTIVACCDKIADVQDNKTNQMMWEATDLQEILNAIECISIKVAEDFFQLQQPP
jgi:hypothetical protein